MRWSLVTAAAVAAVSLLPIVQAEELKKLRCVDQLKVVKDAWDKAPAGPKKDVAHTHYTLALKSYQGLGREKWKRTQERKCLENLEKAMAALTE